MNVLLIGASGFIGRNMCAGLIKGYDLHVPSHDRLDVTSLDSVRWYVRENQIDAIVNCSNPDLRSFFNMVEMGIPLINMGSGAEYDRRLNLERAYETMAGLSIPADEYGFTKYVTGRYADADPLVYNLRLFGVYGPHERKRFVSDTIVAALKDGPITIDQNITMSYLYVKDLAQIIRYILDNQPEWQSVNVVPDETVDIVNVARRICQMTESESTVYVKTLGMNREYSGTNELLKAYIPDITFTPLETGLKETIEYHRKVLYGDTVRW